MKITALVCTAFLLTAGSMYADDRDVIDSGRLEHSWTLPALEKRAVEEHKEVKQLQIEARQSRHDLAEARSGRWPEISFTASGSYLFNPMDAVTVSPEEIANVLDPPFAVPEAEEADYLTLLPEQEPTHYQFSISITQPVFTWGKISNAVRLQELLVRIRDLEVDEKKEEIRTRTAVLVHTLRLMERMSETAGEQHELSRRLVELARQSYEEGFLLEEDVLAARVESRQLNLTANELESGKRKLLAELVRITGLEDLRIDDIVFPDPVDLLSVPLPDKQQLLEQALDEQERPALKMLTLLKQVQEYALKISRGDAYWKPDLALQVDVGYQGPRFPLIEPDWYRQDDHDLTVTLALETTLFDGGKHLHEVRSAREEVESAGISLSQARVEITEEITSRYLEHQVHISRLEYLKLRNELLDKRIESALRQYESGTIREGELLEKKIEGHAYSLKLMQETADALQNYFTILHIAGIE